MDDVLGLDERPDGYNAGSRPHDRATRHRDGCVVMINVLQKVEKPSKNGKDTASGLFIVSNAA
ncbi:hypothetical protein, partial [Acidithiobacillus sp.]|uniref:hypothetical protein n=1 Tax=Acidithiobacillus sp. TaxID=1872118 RepID=UPI003D0013A1